MLDFSRTNGGKWFPQGFGILSCSCWDYPICDISIFFQMSIEGIVQLVFFMCGAVKHFETHFFHNISLRRAQPWHLKFQISMKTSMCLMLFWLHHLGERRARRTWWLSALTWQNNNIFWGALKGLSRYRVVNSIRDGQIRMKPLWWAL